MDQCKIRIGVVFPASSERVFLGPNSRLRIPLLYSRVLGVSGVDYQAVRAQASLAEVLELLGFVVSEISNDQVRGACPLHESPSRNSR